MWDIAAWSVVFLDVQEEGEEELNLTMPATVLAAERRRKVSPLPVLPRARAWGV